MLSSIRIRLTLSYLIVIILAMGLSGLLLLSSLERFFRQAVEDNLITQAQITAQALIPGAIIQAPQGEENVARDRLAPVYNIIQQQQLPDRSNLSLQTENVLLPTEDISPSNMDLSYLTAASLQFSTQLETRIRILDAQGMVLLDSQQEEQGLNLGSDALIEQALGGQYASQTEQSGSEATMYLALPTILDNQLVGVIYLSQPLDDVTIVLRNLRTRWLLSTAIALLLSGVVGLLLSGAITGPLRRLTSAAGAVAQGNFDQQVPVRSQDEIGRLSRAFNQMTTRLQAARQMQIDFVANVSHDLRTPLTSIKGMIETLRAGAVDDLEVRDHFLETIERETDRLTRLVNDLLLLSQADSQALNLRCQSEDLTELVQATVNRLATQARLQEVTFKVETSQDTPLAWIDSDRIEQVLVNLLDNALKYSRPGGTVTVTVAGGPKQSVQVQIRDEGIGIPAEDLARIGQRFYRADKARSRAEGGSGLGLAIAQTLIAAHNSAVHNSAAHNSAAHNSAAHTSAAHNSQFQLESKEGQGTVVTFTLPTP